MPVLFTQSGARKIWSRMVEVAIRLAAPCRQCLRFVTPGHSRAFPSLFATRRASRASRISASPGRSFLCLQLHALRGRYGVSSGPWIQQTLYQQHLCRSLLGGSSWILWDPNASIPTNQILGVGFYPKEYYVS